jgi:hypothetical protein
METPAVRSEVGTLIEVGYDGFVTIDFSLVMDLLHLDMLPCLRQVELSQFGDDSDDWTKTDCIFLNIRAQVISTAFSCPLLTCVNIRMENTLITCKLETELAPGWWTISGKTQCTIDLEKVRADRRSS